MSHLSLGFLVSTALASLFIIPNTAVVRHKHLRQQMEQEAKLFFADIHQNEKVVADAIQAQTAQSLVSFTPQRYEDTKPDVMLPDILPFTPLDSTEAHIPVTDMLPWATLDSPQYKLDVKNDPPDSIINPNDRIGDATTQEPVSPMWLENPSNLVTTYELAPDGKGYYIYERIGGIDVRPPSYISLQDYLEFRRKQDMEKYYKEQSLAKNEGKKKSLIPTIELAKLNDIFGGGAISITPTGSASLQFSIDRNRIQNPSLPLRQQKNTFFNFDQQLQVGVVGNIGDKLKINLSQDTKATFDFENITKIDYTGNEDQILQKLETGNVSMTLGNSLIQGSQNLFGVKAGFKFGPVNVMGLASMDRGQRQTINVKGSGDGLQIESPFKKNIADYDANRHFFLSHFFRSKYDEALSRVPQVYSRINITQIEVWVTNQNFAQATNLRPSIGFIDMGENDSRPYANGRGVIFNHNIQADNDTILPDKASNNLYKYLKSDPRFRDQAQLAPLLESGALRLVNGVDFQLVNVRKLQEGRDFTMNPQLGYVSLNSPLQSDDALFVSYAYTYDDKALQVGEFSNDVPGDTLNATPLFLKMIRPTQLRPTNTNSLGAVVKYPVWDLMMKNVYNIAYGLKPDGFRMQVMYETGTKAGKVNSLPKTQDTAIQNIPLLQLTGLDRLTNNTAPDPDNLFDFIDKLTVVPDKGYIIFPHIEPFGHYLADRLDDPADSSRYVFQPLYDQTYQDAIQKYPELNRFTLEGMYQGGGIGASGGAEIPLNAFNVSPASVTVTANGVRLVQGTDYDVDPSGTKVIIKNAAYLAQGQSIKVDVNAQQAFQMQTKTLMGFRADYSPFKDTKVGFTALTLNERPTNFKTTIGEEPLRNTLWGFDLTSQRDLPFLTKAIDKLPLFATKAPSNMNFMGEWAQFRPGMPKQVIQDSLQGITFIDDFEASKQTYNMTSSQRWKLASFPQHLSTDSLYDPKVEYPNDTLARSYSRALLSWYQIDPQVFNPQFAKIPEIDKENSYTRPITPTEIYTQRTVPAGSGFQSTLDLHYYPTRRGPYNYQYHKEKLDVDGYFTKPKENWAGIMADINTNVDFEAQNVEFIEFWMMDPFMDNYTSNTGGKLYLHLGNVSEDVIPDNLQFFENGLPPKGGKSGTIETDWGYVGASTPAANTFSNDQDSRENQDLGLDGMSTAEERNKFKSYVAQIAADFGTSSKIYQDFEADPSNDDYQHYISQEYDGKTAGINERYAHYYGTENNSPVGKTYNGLTQQATSIPDIEDINKNGSPNTWEEYFEYPIEITKSGLQPGKGYVVDRVNSIVTLNSSGSKQDEVTWYQFRIPIRSGIPRNNIPNFKVVNFLRMYMTGFEQEAVLRFADFQTVSTQWRKYEGSLITKFDTTQTEPCGSFEVGSVSIEDNSRKTPFNYVSPPNVIRQSINGNTTAGLLQDERSLLMKASCLQEGDGRAIFKYVNQDFRNYKKLRMWVHAEISGEALPTTFDRTGDAVAFIRLGLDNNLNYYEYEIPLKPSDPSISGNSSNADSIWKNQFNFELQKLIDAKTERNIALFSTTDRFEYNQDLPEGHKIYIKGTPKLSDVRVIMIGFRNPVTPAEGALDLEMWVDELSLTKLDKSSAWAANASLNLQLADIGTIQSSMQYRQAGFGPIDMRVSQRTREDVLRYSIAGDFQLQKFFPQKWGIQLPFHANWDEQIKNPIFDPREADIKTKDLYKVLPADQRKEAKLAIQDYTGNRGFSFNSIKKNKTGKSPKAHPWDIENIDASFAYSEQLHRDYMVEKNFTNNYRASLNYRYTIKSPNIQPFKKWKHKNPISEFNFSPLPKSVTVSLIGDRQFSEYLYRPTFFGGKTTPVYTKNFVITRNYNLAWDLTKSLTMNFTAANNARVDEVKGYWNKSEQWRKDSIGDLSENLFHYGQDSIIREGVKANGQPYRYVKYFDKRITMGRTIGYNHNINVAYTLPFSKFKPVDFITGNATYAGTFQWQNPPEVNRGLGATIVNGQNITGTGRVDLNALYGKWKPLKKMLDPVPYKPQPKNKTPDKEKDKKDKEAVKKGEIDPKTGKPVVKKNHRPINPDWKDKHKLHPPAELRLLKAIIRGVLRIVLSVKSVDATYNSTAGTTLPGYLPGTDNLGMDFRFRDTTTGATSPLVPPTWGFVAGMQNDIRPLAQSNYWITKDSTLSSYFAQNKTGQLTLKASVEPIPGLKIDLNATRSTTDNNSEMIRWENSRNGYINTGKQFTGSQTMSYVFLNTAFVKDDSVTFAQFSENRKEISKRLADANPYSITLAGGTTVDGYQNGYYRTSQEVLIPAMLASYGMVKTDKVGLTAFPKMPLPNWTINFNPTTAFPQLKEIFTSISIKHTYQGNYTVGNYNRNIFARDYNSDMYGDSAIAVQLTTPLPSGVQPSNFAPVRNIAIVQMQEKFAPLIGVNTTFKNGMTANIAFNKSRTYSFNVGTMQMTEEKSKDITFGLTYRKDKLNMTMHLFKKEINLKNSANFGCQFSLRDSYMLNRNMDGNTTPYLRGSYTLNINPSIDYVINNRVNIKLFWTENVNRPRAGSYPNSFRSIGLQLRLNLQ